MWIRVIIGSVVFAILIMVICLEFSFLGFVNNYWSPIVSTILTSLLAWIAYLSYQRDEPRSATELNLVPLDSDMFRDQFRINDELEEGFRKKGITNLFLIVVTNQSKNPAVIAAIVGNEELFVPLVDTKVNGFKNPAKRGRAEN